MGSGITWARENWCIKKNPKRNTKGLTGIGKIDDGIEPVFSG